MSFEQKSNGLVTSLAFGGGKGKPGVRKCRLLSVLGSWFAEDSEPGLTKKTYYVD
jgi:hypothetical protein